jgi:ferredoxin
MRSQRPFGVRQSPAEGNPPAALAHRAGVPEAVRCGGSPRCSNCRPVEATGVEMRGMRRTNN